MPFFAMRLVEGEPLQEWIVKRRSRGEPPSTAQVVSILKQLLYVLDQISNVTPGSPGHKSSRKVRTRRFAFVHRDIKPSNIMISGSDGEEVVTLLDFGIGRFFTTQQSENDFDDSSRTFSSILNARTPGYESPEMMLRPNLLDVRSDLFQLGLLGFEMMTGKRYWNAWPQQHEELQKERAFPRSLRRAIVRSLQWDRTARYTSPAEFSNALTFSFKNIVLSNPWRAWQLRL